MQIQYTSPPMQLPEHPFKEEIQSYYEQARKELPPTVTLKAEQEAWIARRTIEISEKNVSQTRALQALLLSYIYENNIWLNHPDRPETFRDFLKSIGTEQEGNKLSPSTISDFAVIAEIIAPYCEYAEIPLRMTLTGKNWPKFRETIPTLRHAIEEDDDPKPVIEAVMRDIKQLPTRDAVREKYRQSRSDKIGVGDALQLNGHTHVHLVIDSDQWPQLKSQLSKRVDWEVLMLHSDTEVHIPLEGE